jgi:hypothetical protein
MRMSARARGGTVTGELMIERGFLSFEDCQRTCDGDKCGTPTIPGYQQRPTDYSTYRVLHMTSVTILCMFEIEFFLMFYAVGFRCCCRKGAAFVLLDFVIVSMALVAEVWYLATTNTSVLFVLILRVIRILNGLIQQQVRNQEKQHRRIEAKEEELHERESTSRPRYHLLPRSFPLLPPVALFRPFTAGSPRVSLAWPVADRLIAGYDHQMRDMIMQSDEAAEQLVMWKAVATDAVSMLEVNGITADVPQLPAGGRRAAAPELIDQGAVNPAMMRERVEFMRQVPMLKQLSKDQLMKLAYDLTEQKFRPGDRIIIVGDVGDCMYIVEEGEAGAYIDGVGQVVAYGPGDFFGELALITRQKRGATIIANAPVLALVLDRSLFEMVKSMDNATTENNFEEDDGIEPTATAAAAAADVSVEVGDAPEDPDDGLMRRRPSAVGFTVDAHVIVDGEAVEVDPPQKPAPPGEYDSKR